VCQPAKADLVRSSPASSCAPHQATRGARLSELSPFESQRKDRISAYGFPLARGISICNPVGLALHLECQRE
jgi:hypothetical protein